MSSLFTAGATLPADIAAAEALSTAAATTAAASTAATAIPTAAEFMAMGLPATQASGIGSTLASWLAPATVSSMFGQGSNRPMTQDGLPDINATDFGPLPKNLIPMLESYGKMGA